MGAYGTMGTITVHDGDTPAGSMAAGDVDVAVTYLQATPNVRFPVLGGADTLTVTAFAEPVGDRQGQLVAGPHGSMPPEEYFPGALCEPGIVPDAKLHAEALEQGVEVAQPPREPKDPLAAFA